MNRKRIQRLWRQEGLKRPQICRKRRRLGPTLTERLRAAAPNQVWAIDFQFDETADQRRLVAGERRRRVHPGVPGHPGGPLL